ncbi:MAG TPA: type I methionyl aminopeptidase [Patescibacteria group bacterium]|nr:type I methionyl aminopeptidase [Patescibacteria group bacterium]
MTNITIKTPEEIEKLRAGGKILHRILLQLAAAVRPGVKKLELDRLARKLIAEAGAKPSFEGFGTPPYPAALCISVNDVLVHGIPDEREIKEGDLVGLDLGIWYQDLCTDHALTVAAGKISKEAKKLLKVTQKSLAVGLKQIKPGKTLGDFGQAVQQYVESHGFSVIRKLVGHGVGYEVHEEPRIPNFGHTGTGEVLEAGMVLALEPMVSAGQPEIVVLANEWDIAMKDKSLAAHFEHTVAVTEKGCEILTR